MADVNVEAPRVSIITGFYNRGHLLDRTLQSLLKQTYPNFEIIVFDDCSTDDTQSRLAEYEVKYGSRLRVIRHATRLGFTRGMINAIENSDGEFIAVHGSGDTASENRISAQVEAFRQRPDLTVVGSHYVNIVESTGVKRLRTPDASKVTFNSLMRQNLFSHGEVMMRRSAYEQAGGYRAEFESCQDLDLWLRMIKIGPFATVPEPLYQRYILFDGISYDPPKALKQWRYSVLTKRLARMDPDQAEATLRILRGSEGLSKLVPSHDPELQRKVFSASLRLLAWGRADVARSAAAYLEDQTYCVLFNLVYSVVNTKYGSHLAKLFLRALGVLPAGA
jgi:glycosyltransferase involved in cell wall biosynthesis